jgi:hypothetical protein
VASLSTKVKPQLSEPPLFGLRHHLVVGTENDDVEPNDSALRKTKSVLLTVDFCHR